MPYLDFSSLARYSSDYTEVMNNAISKNGNNPLTPDEKTKLFNAFNSFQKSSTTSSNTITPKGSTDAKAGIMGTFGKLVTGYLDTQDPSGQMKSYSEQVVKVKDAYSMIFNEQGKINKLSDIGANIMKGIGNQLQQYYDEQANLLVIANKQMGLTGQFSKDFREELTKASEPLVRIGVGFQELVDSSKYLIDTSGRFLTLNAETWEKAGKAGQAFVGSLQQLTGMLPDYEKVGLGASDATREIVKAGKGSLDVGLQSQKVTSEMRTNLGKLNEFGFKNGVQGLAEMTRKALEFRMSMDEVFTVAKAVMNPEGALELSANLQVLGGAIGDFNDPLKLMYMATNNVEGLQDALIGAAQGLATYNQEQGRFEITGVNLRRAQEMAKQLGINYNELAKGAIAAAERTSASADLMARGLTLKEDQKEFLTNISQMKDGKMTIELNSDRLKNVFGKSEVALDSLTQSQAELLLQYQEDFKQKTQDEIIRGQATDIQNIMRDVNYIAIIARNRAGKLGQDVANKIYNETGYGVAGMAKFSKELADQAPQIVGGVEKEVRKFLNVAETNKIKEIKKGKLNEVPSLSVNNANNNTNNNTNTTPNNNTNNATTTKVDIQLSAKGPAYDYIEVGNKRSYTYQSTPQ